MKIKKQVALVLSAVLILSLAAACAKQTVTPQAGKDTPVATTPLSQDSKIRTDVVIGSTSDVVSLDPHGTNDTTSARGFLMIYNSLLMITPEAQVEPMLAKSYEQTSPTQYVFKLNQGVKFHNGEELTAEDVKFSLERQISKPKVKAYVERITAINVLDKYTVEINTDVPYSPLLLNLAGTQASILNKKAVLEAEANGGKYGDNPVGTGPMKFKEWKVNDEISFVKNEDYFFGPGQTTSVTIRVIPEASSMTIALEMGEIDFIGSVGAVDIGKVKSNTKLKTIDMQGAGISYMTFNQRVAPFDNVKVRQALNYAINKQNMVDVILESYGKTLNSPFSSILPGFDESLDLYPYSLEKAKALLAEAGYASGFAMELATSGDERNRVAQLVQADLSLVGITVKIELMEWGAFLDYIGGTTYQAIIIGWSNSINPDNSMSPLFHSASCGISGNDAWYQNPEVDAMIEEARTESDWAVREPIYKALQKKIMEDAVWVPLYQKMNVIAMNKGTEGVIIYPSESHRYVNMIVKE